MWKIEGGLKLFGMTDICVDVRISETISNSASKVVYTIQIAERTTVYIIFVIFCNSGFHVRTQN